MNVKDVVMNRGNVDVREIVMTLREISMTRGEEIRTRRVLLPHEERNKNVRYVVTKLEKEQECEGGCYERTAGIRT